MRAANRDDDARTQHGDDRAILEALTGVSADPLPAHRPPGNDAVLGRWLVHRVDNGARLRAAISDLLDRFPAFVRPTDSLKQRAGERELARKDARRDAKARLKRVFYRERERQAIGRAAPHPPGEGAQPDTNADTTFGVWDTNT